MLEAQRPEIRLQVVDHVGVPAEQNVDVFLRERTAEGPLDVAAFEEMLNPAAAAPPRRARRLAGQRRQISEPSLARFERPHLGGITEIALVSRSVNERGHPPRRLTSM